MGSKGKRGVRWAGVLLFANVLLAAGGRSSEVPAIPASWPAWQQFSDRFIQADGRVIDLTFDQKSTSEGQAYGLFFALVANRQAQFDTILAWTAANLAAGQLGERLPGWLWGKRETGDWGLKDANAAADADLWLAYTLLEAGRLWHQARYTALGHKVLALIRDQEVTLAGKAGTVLLPGPIGFELGKRFRLNPSYLPGFQLRYLAAVDPRGPWSDLWESYLRMAPAIFSAGVAPDLFIVSDSGAVTQDTERQPSGSYDAIRVYLWAGMSGTESGELRVLLKPYVELIRAAGSPPEKVNPATGVAIEGDYRPVGFAGAVLPFVHAIQEPALEKNLLNRLRIDAVRVRLGGASNYYDQALILFGQGWQEGYYRFSDSGQLQPKWLR